MNDILRNAFYEEAEELFEKIEECILEMDQTGPTKDNVDSLFRYMHTLKGSSAAMQLNDMATLTHRLEDVLGLVRDGKLEVTREMIDVMLESLDELKAKVSMHRNDEDYEIQVNKYIAVINSFQSGKTSGAQEGTHTGSSKTSVQGDDAGSLKDGEKAYNIRIHLSEDTPMKGVRLFLVTEKLREHGQIQYTSWDESAEEEIDEQDFDITYVSKLAEKEIEDLVYSVSDIQKAVVSEIQTGISSEPKKMDTEKLQTVIRVNIKKLDHLLRVVEELSVDKERLKQTMKKVEQKYAKDRDIQELSNLVQQMDFISNELQESVMSTRMYTLESVFNRFPRMIRDLSKKQGKEIVLKVEGESTELDRSIMEKIIDPLNHIVRNSIDHGLETPEEREKQGKNRKGTIKISAGQKHGHIFIRVEDDGRGINLEGVKRKAIKNGLITEEEAETLTDREIMDLIFLPGFSTADKITDISGRGVGMNVVKENIEQINGIIDIHSSEGRGTAITLQLPLTLAIIQALLIKCNQYRFALPLLSILEIFRVKENEYDQKVKSVSGKEVMNWRGEILPVLRIADLFHIDAERKNSFIGIVVGASTRKVILAVEEVTGQQQVVIKPLEKYTGESNVLGEVRGISGTVILGDGELAYVLDVHSLLKEDTGVKKGSHAAAGS